MIKTQSTDLIVVSTAKVLIAAAIVLGLTYTGYYLLSEPQNFLENDAQFGAFFGGVVGSLFTAAGVILLYQTLKLQKTEFQTMQKQLTIQGKAMEQQLLQLQIQSLINHTSETKIECHKLQSAILRVFGRVKVSELEKYLRRTRESITDKNNEVDNAFVANVRTASSDMLGMSVLLNDTIDRINKISSEEDRLSQLRFFKVFATSHHTPTIYVVYEIINRLENHDVRKYDQIHKNFTEIDLFMRNISEIKEKFNVI